MRYKNATIRVRTQIPDMTDLDPVLHDWSNTPYANAKEKLPTDGPTPRGKPVLITTYADSNLYHNTLSGKSVSGVLHYINKTPLDWYCRLTPHS